MSDVNVQLVREFFELNGFRTMTYWQHDRVRPRTAEHGLQLFVQNGGAALARELEFVLRIGDAACLDRALVEVRPWHADQLYASLIKNDSILYEVGSEDSLARGKQVFGDEPFSRVLVISELPSAHEARQRTLDMLANRGIDHLLEFPTILYEMLDKLNPDVSYAPSITLQTLRLVKRYGFVRRQQLEFPFHNEPLLTALSPRFEVAEDAPGEEIDLL